jgi:hypothetical protein
MSVMLKARLLWVLPVAVVGSWLAVRTLAASTGAVRVTAPAMMTMSLASPAPAAEFRDAALARRISRLAERARQG